MTEPMDIALLATIAELAGDGVTSTEPIAVAHAGELGPAPWFGLWEPLERLRDEGLIEITDSALHDRAASEPAPVGGLAVVRLTEDGRRALEPRNSA